MSADTFATGPFCAAVGCRDDAHAIVIHPDHGRRAACRSHADGLEVLRRV